jgi:hypothetical protein
MSDLPIGREHRTTIRALLLGGRIETAGLERNDVLSTIPMAFRAEKMARPYISEEVFEGGRWRRDIALAMTAWWSKKLGLGPSRNTRF